MKVDNFVLLIISIVTLIIISLVTECNRGRLKELEDKAEKEIKETFFGHLGPADPTEPGQWGYKITDITEGQYGGRSRQEVLNNIGGHDVNDYITNTDFGNYNSNLFNSIIDNEIISPISCQYNNLATNCDLCQNNKLSQGYSITQTAQYGGQDCDFDLIDSNMGYDYIKKDGAMGACDGLINNNSIISIVLQPNFDSNNQILNYNITNLTDSSQWCGFLKVSELYDPPFNIKTTDNSQLSVSKQIDIQTKDNLELLQSNLPSDYEYYKFKKDNKYINVDISFGTPSSMPTSFQNKEYMVGNNQNLRFTTYNNNIEFGFYEQDEWKWAYLEVQSYSRNVQTNIIQFYIDSTQHTFSGHSDYDTLTDLEIFSLGWHNTETGENRTMGEIYEIHAMLQNPLYIDIDNMKMYQKRNDLDFGAYYSYNGTNYLFTQPLTISEN